MKKILLLLVSGLLIACMAGSALAADSYLVNATTNLPITNDDLVRANGDTLSVKFVVTGYTSVNLNTEYTLGYDVAALPLADPIGKDSDVTVVIIGNPTFTLPSPIVNNYRYDGATVFITLNGAPAGATYLVNIKADDQLTDENGDIIKQIELASSSLGMQAIPEFPTVALPVAAILGLVFIFGRKKDGL